MLVGLLKLNLRQAWTVSVSSHSLKTSADGGSGKYIYAKKNLISSLIFFTDVIFDRSDPYRRTKIQIDAQKTYILF